VCGDLDGTIRAAFYHLWFPESWWGLGTARDLRLTKLLDRSVGSNIWWAP